MNRMKVDGSMAQQHANEPRLVSEQTLHSWRSESVCLFIAHTNTLREACYLLHLAPHSTGSSLFYSALCTFVLGSILSVFFFLHFVGFFLHVESLMDKVGDTFSTCWDSVIPGRA